MIRFTTSLESLGKTPSAAVAWTTTLPAVSLWSNAGYSGNSSLVSGSASASSSLASSVLVCSLFSLVCLSSLVFTLT